MSTFFYKWCLFFKKIIFGSWKPPLKKVASTNQNWLSSSLSALTASLDLIGNIPAQKEKYDHYDA